VRILTSKPATDYFLQLDVLRKVNILKLQILQQSLQFALVPVDAASRVYEHLPLRSVMAGKIHRLPITINVHCLTNAFFTANFPALGAKRIVVSDRQLVR
jgi:hypothetical protein